MRIVKAVVFMALAACGGSQGSNKQTIESPPDDKGEEAERVVKEMPPPPPPKPLTTEERVAFHDGCFADFIAEKPDFFTRCYSETSSDELVDGGEPPAVGVEAITAANKPFWDAFKLEGEIRLDLASGENVITIGVVRGTQEADFMGMPSAGKTWGLLLAEVQNLDEQGRHGTVRSYGDLAQMMGQLGAAPKGMKFRPAMELSGAPPVTAIASGSEAEDANLALVQGGFDKFNAKDWKGLVGLYAADAVISEQMAPADNKGTKAITKMFKELGKAFPDAHEELGAIWAAGEYVVVETTFTGTNKAAAPGRGIKKATKKAVTLRTAHVLHVVDGKIKEHWIFGNGLAMAMQLGLVPTPPPPAPAK